MPVDRRALPTATWNAGHRPSGRGRQHVSRYSHGKRIPLPRFAHLDSLNKGTTLHALRLPGASVPRCPVLRPTIGRGDHAVLAGFGVVETIDVSAQSTEAEQLA